MKTKKNILKLIALLGTLGFVACAPKVQEPTYENPKNQFGPRNSDSDVREKGNLQSFQFDQFVTMNGQVSVGPMYRMAENISALGEISKNSSLSGLGRDLTLKIQKLAATPVAVSDTPYIQLLITETRDEVRQVLVQLEADLLASQKILVELAHRQGAGVQWPKGPIQPLAAAQFAGEFLMVYAESVAQSEALDIVKEQVHTELQTQRETVLKLGAEVQAQLPKIRRLGDFLNYIEQLMIREEMEIPPELRATLFDGKNIARGLGKCGSAQDALAVIVDVWKMLEPEQRKQYFKPVNEDLYSLLDGKDDKELQCLKQENCKGILKDLMKSMFILPKLEQYGVEKICQELNDQALAYAKNAVSEEISTILPTLPQILTESLNESFAKQLAELRGIRSNYGKFIKEKVTAWSQESLPNKGQILGLEAAQLKTSLVRNKMNFTPVIAPVTSEGLGASLAAFQSAWKAGGLAQDIQIQTGLEMINRLAALGGYPTEFGNMAPALLSPMNTQAPTLDLTRITELTSPYAMTDALTVKNGFTPVVDRPNRINLSAKSQAELVRGLSEILFYLRDWETTSFDQSLGLVTASQMLPEYKDVPDLQRSLFPKESLMALAIGDLAVSLQNLTKERSQFFVVGLKNSVTWVNDFNFETGDAAVMAGVVDIENGERKDIVRSEDVARWVLALGTFLKASEGIENTKSSLLLEVDASGKRPLDTFLDARRQIKLLMVGLANFLSHQMMDGDGFIHSELTLPGLVPSQPKNKSVLDQMLSIRALLMATEITKVDIYQISATEIYYHMNNHLFQAKLRFYSFESKTESPEKIFLPVLVEGLRALSELKPHLPSKSQEQLDWILEPWISGLRELSL